MKYGLKDSTIGQINQVFSRHKEIERVLIYGSRAKGNFKPGSDIDLTFIGEQMTPSLLNQITDEIDDLFLPYTFDLSILSRVTNPDFLAHINRVAYVFYDRGASIEMTV